MSASVMTCRSCHTRNRVPDDVAGTPRCSRCHTDLPWLIEVGSDELERVIERSTIPVLLDLWAPWCAPCRAVAPALEQLAVDRAGSVRVVKVNVDAAPDVSRRLGVQGIPTMVVFARGAEVGRLVGARPGGAIRDWVDALLRA